MEDDLFKVRAAGARIVLGGRVALTVPRRLDPARGRQVKPGARIPAGSRAGAQTIVAQGPGGPLPPAT